MFDYQKNLEEIARRGAARSLQKKSGIDFCSNDYLGLSKSNYLNSKLIDFIKTGKNLWATSSRHIHGTTEVHLQAESFLADFLRREEVLLFNSGYVANLGVIESLCKDAVIFSDQLNHVSLIEGIKKSKSRNFIYQHNDLNQLEDLLRSATRYKGNKFIITESVFSMDGTLSDVGGLAFLCEKYAVFLILDEAHATGVFGEEGRGMGAHLPIDEDRLLTVHTCGKALASFGAFVGCSKIIKKYLVNKCRHLIYSTALPPLVVFSNLPIDQIYFGPSGIEKKIVFQHKIHQRKIGMVSGNSLPDISRTDSRQSCGDGFGRTSGIGWHCH